MNRREQVGGRDGSGFGRRLRLEAARTRPAVSPALQERIVEAAVREHAAGVPRRGPGAGRAAAVLVALACVAVAAWLPSRWPRLVPAPPSAVAQEPSIDALPSFEEIGDALAEGTAALAAEAVGIPRWNDLVAAGRLVIFPGDDGSRPLTP